MDGLIVATIVEKWIAATAATATSLSCYRFELFSKAFVRFLKSIERIDYSSNNRAHQQTQNNFERALKIVSEKYFFVLFCYL
jgi:hypothetical protein